MAGPPAADRPDEDLDFDLRIRPTGAGSSTFTAYVANSPAGNAESVFQLPVRGVELENFLLRIGQPRRPVRRAAGRGSLSDLAKSFGGQLFESVFVDDVATCLRTSEDLARSGTDGCGYASE